jgi:hypothetical protein
MSIGCVESFGLADATTVLAGAVPCAVTAWTQPTDKLPAAASSAVVNRNLN